MSMHAQLGEQNDTEETKWWSELQVSSNFIAYRTKLLSMQSKFQHRWEGHLGRTQGAKHQIGLILSDKRPVKSVPFKASPCAWEFEKYEIDKLWIMDVFKLTQT